MSTLLMPRRRFVAAAAGAALSLAAGRSAARDSLRVLVGSSAGIESERRSVFAVLGSLVCRFGPDASRAVSDWRAAAVAKAPRRWP